MKNRTDIINFLIERHSFKTYLEIGTHDPNRNFNKIRITNKECVDPNPRSDSITYQVTSDEFFKLIDNNKRYDIIFIDGLHLEHQVDKDILNSLKHLNRNGFIVVHDCNPITEFRQREQYEVNGKFPEWNGTVWKSWVKLRCNNPMLKMYVVDIDTGCGVITSGSQMLWDGVSVSACLEYSYLAENRKKLLNLISVDEFIGDFIDG